MSIHRDQLAEAIRATVIHSPSGFSWFGRSNPPLPPRIRAALTPEILRNYLLLSLQETFYSYFYCRGSAVPIDTSAAVPSRPGGDPAFMRELSEANHGSGSWEDGWVTKFSRGEVRIAERDGLRLRAGPGDWRESDVERLAGGTGLALRLPREWLGMSPGFYMAIGDAPLAASDAEAIVRLYWHTSPEGAIQLMRDTTARFNAANLPFKLKALNDPSAFVRCDAAVLYIRKVDYDPVADMLERTYSELGPFLRQDVPVFTKRLAPGLGFAEDPGNSESFGSSRCQLVAEGLLRAFENGSADAQERLKSVDRCLSERGINLDEPFLNGGSADVYQFRPGTKARADAGADASSSVNCPNENLLENALAIARRLSREAVWSGDRCNWVGSFPDFESGHTGEPASRLAALGPDVYSGTGGLALFLAEVHAETGDTEVGRTALGAIRHALSSIDTSTTRAALGFYSGWTGVALSAARTGILLEAPSLLKESGLLVRRLASARHSRGDFDLMSGRAGAIPALLILKDILRDESLLDLSVRIGDQLLRSADQRGLECSWRASSPSSRRDLTGFSHGTAGVGYALLELFHATGERRFRDAGMAAFQYERRWFDPHEKNWPDFRRAPGGGTGNGTTRSFSFAWCHGAPGIALSRLRAFEITGEELCRHEAEIALETTRGAVEAELARGGWNSSLCHGLAGNADVLLCGFQALGTRMFPVPAILRQVACAILDSDFAKERGRKEARPFGDSWGLMAGLAGTGYVCLRLRDPNTPSLLLLKRESFLVTSRPDRSSPPSRHPSGRWPRNPRP